jgi:hypothetical protein
MMPVVFKSLQSTVTVEMASNSSMGDIQQRFAEEMCLHALKRRSRVSNPAAAAEAAEMAHKLVITCSGRVLREESLADACLSAGATVEVLAPLDGGMFSCCCIKHAVRDEAEEGATEDAPRKDSAAGGARRGRSMYRSGLERAVRGIAKEAAAASKAWRDKTDGGKRVTSHSLRSAFMNQVDPGKDTTPVFPGKAPFHPQDRYPSLLIACTLATHPTERLPLAGFRNTTRTRKRTCSSPTPGQCAC